MRFRPTSLAGCVVVEPELNTDARGGFARVFCAEEFQRAGLVPTVSQCSISVNIRRGTLRGLHYQRAPHEEARLVTCVRGRIFDVAVDIRPGSPTFGKWTALELEPATRLALYVPPGFAHGFMTLEPDTDVHYQMSVPYHPESTTGISWDDPDLAIDWPQIEPLTMSRRDASLPRLVDAEGRAR